MILTVTYSQNNLDAYRVKDIRAYLIYENTGLISQEVSNFDSLWNTPIGEGDAGGPSTQVLFFVEVNGNNYNNENRKLEVNVVENGKVILKRSEAIYIPENEEKNVFAFLLYNVGMRPVTINAKIVGQKISSALIKDIPFASGE